MTRAAGFEDGVVPDLVDLRDIEYRSTLRGLPGSLIPRYLGLAQGDSLKVPVRHQRETPRCTGFALGSLIDYLRIVEQSERGTLCSQFVPVSAAMLYRMGWLISADLSDREQNRLLSIRSVIKGFYHNGVCLTDDWRDDDESGFNIDRAKAARRVTLGAYFRVLPFLSHYHSALDEVGAILVSAYTHSGWRTEEVRRHGRIVTPGADLLRANDQHGAHAFVLVGYDADGFFVLNSWGEQWGGKLMPSGQSLRGVAHWSYKDWADSIIDAWVLRLAVPTPKAFEFTLGPQGRMIDNASASVSTGSTPRLFTLGHYVHFEHGGYVETGSYPSSEESLRQTLDYIGSDLAVATESAGHEKIYVRVVGDTADVDSSMRRIAEQRRYLRPNGVYPLSLLWLSRTASAFALGIRGCMAEAVRRMPQEGGDRDRLIEFMVADLGWPLWQQSQRDAQLVAAHGGPLDLICTRLRKKLANGPGGCELFLTFEGVGALVFVALLLRLKAKSPQYLDHVKRITLALPIVSAAALTEALWDADPEGDIRNKMLLLVPDRASCAAMRLPPYSKSWFDLVDNSFQPRSASAGDRYEMLPMAGLKWDPDDMPEPLKGIRLYSRLVPVGRSSDSEDCIRNFFVSQETLASILKDQDRPPAIR